MRHKHHQLLTADTGIEQLDRQVGAVMSLLRVAYDREDFGPLFSKAFPPAPINSTPAALRHHRAAGG